MDFSNTCSLGAFHIMNHTKNKRDSSRGMELLHLLSESGKKIFNTAEAKGFAPFVGIPIEYVSKVLHLLQEDGWIIPLKNGLFALSKGFSTKPLHEFEIAMALAKPVAISHWSALHYHGLSDQIPKKVFLLASQEVTIPRQRGSPFGIYTVQGISFVFSRIKTELFFGVTQIWVNRSKISITDPERTLLDGLDKPQLCGGFNEVLHAFQVFKQRINIEKILSYALQWDSNIVKRLGWVLSQIEF
jgi:predicted transcriptional regulator of viral defense system